MPAADFLDSNVVIYAYSQDAAKKHAALVLLAGAPTISTQVLNETINVLRRKNLMADGLIPTAINDLVVRCQVTLVDVETIRSALDVMARYQLSYFDALMVATAIEAGCTTLYSEDMQDGQVLNGALTIKNPFRVA